MPFGSKIKELKILSDPSYFSKEYNLTFYLLTKTKMMPNKYIYQARLHMNERMYVILTGIKELPTFKHYTIIYNELTYNLQHNIAHRQLYKYIITHYQSK